MAPGINRNPRPFPFARTGLGVLAMSLAFPSAAEQPQSTARIAEWAASDRGGRADYQELAHGREIDISRLPVPGKVTIVDFSSDYCAPCVELAMYLIKISKAHPERYAIRRVNINRPGVVGIDYDSPVSRQYKLSSLPMIVVFDHGSRVAEAVEARKWLLDDVARMEAKAAEAGGP
jgi:thiol-disulfide isomerase/thioredoxin